MVSVILANLAEGETHEAIARNYHVAEEDIQAAISFAADLVGDSLALTGGTASGTLTYSTTGLPSGLSIKSATGLISGTLGMGTAKSTPYDVAVTAGDGVAGANGWSVDLSGKITDDAALDLETLLKQFQRKKEEGIILDGSGRFVPTARVPDANGDSPLVHGIARSGR
jgi:hypothetical protein